MFVQLIAVCMIFTCNAQEHLTCLRTDDVINPSLPPTPNVQQGRPGRRGPPGIPADNSQIDTLRVDVDSMTRALRRGYMEMGDGWIAPFNGYQYKANLSLQTWEDSRRTCQSWGGDLAVYGMREFGMRAKIARALRLPASNFWIGLSDSASEGNWRWVSGHQARTDDATLWFPGQPSGGEIENCGRLIIHSSSVNGYLVSDLRCSHQYRSICEKLV